MKQWAAVLAAVLLLLCSGCAAIAGMGDWEYELPNQFAIWRINSRNIVLNDMSEKQKGTPIDGYIISFCAGERFVGIKRAVSVPKDLEEEIDRTRYHFYLVDTLLRRCYGPYTSNTAYDAACKDLGAADLGKWLDTVPAPKGSDFG